MVDINAGSNAGGCVVHVKHGGKASCCVADISDGSNAGG